MTNNHPLILACIEATRCLADFEGGDNEIETLAALHAAEDHLMTALDDAKNLHDFAPLRELGNNICELIENAIH